MSETTSADVITADLFTCPDCDKSELIFFWVAAASVTRLEISGESEDFLEVLQTGIAAMSDLLDELTGVHPGSRRVELAPSIEVAPPVTVPSDEI